MGIFVLGTTIPIRTAAEAAAAAVYLYCVVKNTHFLEATIFFVLAIKHTWNQKKIKTILCAMNFKFTYERLKPGSLHRLGWFIRQNDNGILKSNHMNFSLSPSSHTLKVTNEWECDLRVHSKTSKQYNTIQTKRKAISNTINIKNIATNRWQRALKSR